MRRERLLRAPEEARHEPLYRTADRGTLLEYGAIPMGSLGSVLRDKSFRLETIEHGLNRRIGDVVASSDHLRVDLRDRAFLALPQGLNDVELALAEGYDPWTHF